MYKSWMWKQRSYREQFQGTEGGAAAGGAAIPDDQAQGEPQAAGETPNAEQQAAPVDQQAEDDGEVIISIGDEAPPSEDGQEEEIPPAQRAAWARMRKTERELKQRVREFEQAEAARVAAAAPKAEDVGPEPDIGDEGIDFDAGVFKDKWKAWNDRKTKADAKAAAERTEQEAALADWNKKLTTYRAAAASLKVDDFDGAEHVVRETMSQTQIGVMLNGADKPELLVYALGRNPAKAKELAGIKDPVKFAFALAKLEVQLKVTPKKTPPAPEREVRGTAGGATGVDNTLARLQADADKSGDRSKVAAYLREQKRRAAA